MILKKAQPLKSLSHVLKVVLNSIGLMLALGSACSQAQDPRPSKDIWEAPVLSQPFDVEPFRPIRIPRWVEQTIGCGYTLSVMSTEQRQQAVAHGVSISEMGFVDPFYAYYDSQLLKRRSPHVPPDRTKKDILEYEKLGLRILAVYPPCLQAEVYEAHPEWRRIATNTTEIPTIDLKQFPHGGMLCLLGPYGDFMISVLEEILTQFPEVDAFSFDGLHYGGVCYCEHCRKAYREATGAEIPTQTWRISPSASTSIGRIARWKPRPAHATTAQGHPTRGRLDHLVNQCRTVWTLPEYSSQYAFAHESIIGCS